MCPHCQSKPLHCKSGWLTLCALLCFSGVVCLSLRRYRCLYFYPLLSLARFLCSSVVVYVFLFSFLFCLFLTTSVILPLFIGPNRCLRASIILYPSLPLYQCLTFYLSMSTFLSTPIALYLDIRDLTHTHTTRLSSHIVALSTGMSTVTRATVSCPLWVQNDTSRRRIVDAPLPPLGAGYVSRTVRRYEASLGRLRRARQHCYLFFCVLLYNTTYLFSLAIFHDRPSAEHAPSFSQLSRHAAMPAHRRGKHKREEQSREKSSQERQEETSEKTTHKTHAILSGAMEVTVTTVSFVQLHLTWLLLLFGAVIYFPGFGIAATGRGTHAATERCRSGSAAQGVAFSRGFCLVVRWRRHAVAGCLG